MQISGEEIALVTDLVGRGFTPFEIVEDYPRLRKHKRFIKLAYSDSKIVNFRRNVRDSLNELRFTRDEVLYLVNLYGHGIPLLVDRIKKRFDQEIAAMEGIARKVGL